MPLEPEHPYPRSPEEARGLSTRVLDKVDRVIFDSAWTIHDHFVTGTFFSLGLALHPRQVVRALKTEGVKVLSAGYKDMFENMPTLVRSRRFR